MRMRSPQRPDQAGETEASVGGSGSVSRLSLNGREFLSMPSQSFDMEAVSVTER